MLTSTSIATQNGSYKRIEFSYFGVYKAWQFFKYTVRRDLILETKTFIGTHIIKRCETFFARPPILAGSNGLSLQG